MVGLSNAKPLFVATMAELWARMRLSNVDDSEQRDSASIMRSALVDARLTIYERLGKQRVDDILATAEVSEPSSDAELARSRAGQLEVRLVRRRLMQDLPVLFRDASGQTLDEWNQEALTREGPGTSAMQRALDALTADIEADFALLDTDEETIGSGGHALSIGPPADRVLPVPGGSLLARPPNVWNGNPGKFNQW